MNRYIIAAAAVFALLLLFLLLGTAQEQKNIEQPAIETPDTITVLPIQKKSDKKNDSNSGEILSETDENVHKKREDDAAFSPSEIQSGSEVKEKRSIGEIKDLLYRKREEEARAKGPEALERFYEREKEIAERKAVMQARAKAEDSYFEAQREWLREMAKARKEGDAAKIMELQKNRPVPPSLHKKRSEEQ